jgi:hypothetical protein
VAHGPVFAAGHQLAIVKASLHKFGGKVARLDFGLVVRMAVECQCRGNGAQFGGIVSVVDFARCNLI